MTKHWGLVILCDTSSRDGGRCTLIDDRPLPRPGCDPRCSEYRQPDGYTDAEIWADEMLRTHEQKQCSGCGLWSVWVPSVAADDLARGSAS